MSNPWFRMYARFIIDPVVEELAFEDQRHFIFLLCMKCFGLLDKEFPSSEMRERAIGRRLGLQGEALTNAKQRLVASQLVDQDWQPTSWDKLQFVSDRDPTSTQRKRNQRDRQRHAHVTRDTSVPSRTSHGEVTRTDTDTDTDTEADKNKSYTDSQCSSPKKEKQKKPKVASDDATPPSGLNLAAWEKWATYRHEQRWPIRGELAIKAAQKKLARFGERQMAVVDQSIENSWRGLFDLKPETTNATRQRVYIP